MRILIPPGIGDAYWVLVKLQAFLRREGVTKPDVSVVCTPDSYGSQWRSIPYLEMIPFINVGYPNTVPNDPELYDTYLEAYNRIGRTIYPGFMGYDYFISYNGILNGGGWIEETDTDLECNWYPERDVSEQELEYEQLCLSKYGKYAVFYWPMFGSFEHHLEEFPARFITTALQRFIKDTGLTAVFTGAFVDTEINDNVRHMIARIPGAVNLVGKTLLEQTFGLLRGSQIVVGYHSGLTNMAVVLKKKTVLLWSDRLPRSIALACFPPDTRNTTYHPLFCKDLTVDRLVSTLLQVI